MHNYRQFKFWKRCSDDHFVSFLFYYNCINIQNNQWLIFRLQKQAVDVAVRYRANGFSASEDAAFFLLLDLMTFFDLFHSKKIDEALDIISKIKVKIIMKKLDKNKTQTLECSAGAFSKAALSLRIWSANW